VFVIGAAAVPAQAIVALVSLPRAEVMARLADRRPLLRD
jgi:hypothetical protein